MRTPCSESDITRLNIQIKELEERNARLAGELRERNKELLFHNSLSQFLENAGVTGKEVYQYVVGLLPSPFQFNEHLDAYIQVGANT